MQAYDVYKDISERTGGDIYIGVVGAVRTGKSTFIRNMMDLLVLPRIQDAHEKQRITDELPQSGAGRTIMTTQPKFVPGEAVSVDIDGRAELRIRMVDCVGYLIPGALGQNEEDAPRMVKTPWYDHDIPFEQAAEIGTKKVIDEHATIGVVLTTDGSIAGIPRENYIAAEERVVSELKQIGKPFVVVLNSASPHSLEAQALKNQLSEKYGVSVVLMDVLNMGRDDVNLLLSDILYEFPVRKVNYAVSGWLCSLDPDHWLFREILQKVEAAAEQVTAMKDFRHLLEPFEEEAYIRRVSIDEILPGEGSILIDMDLKQELFYQILGQECGCEIQDDGHLMELIKELMYAKQQYDRLEGALREVENTGYGIVRPTMEEMTLEEPEMVKQGSRFGVRLKASAPSLHLIRVDVETEVSPIVGTESQSREFVGYLMEEFQQDPGKLWETDLFGKSIYTIVQEGLAGKMASIPDEAREKLREAMGRMINEGDAGVLCILL
jgi:stage IV sporulation protein A